MRLLIFALILGLLTAFILHRARRAQPQQAANRPPPTATMDVDEALRVLDLEPSAERDQIIAAHRRLMQKIHPDHGGSTYLAQQLNEVLAPNRKSS